MQDQYPKIGKPKIVSFVNNKTKGATLDNHFETNNLIFKGCDRGFPASHVFFHMEQISDLSVSGFLILLHSNIITLKIYIENMI